MSKASREAAGRWRLPALLAGVLTLLAGCSVGSGGGYTFAWYILSPSDSRGQANLSFLLKGFWATISIHQARPKLQKTKKGITFCSPHHSIHRGATGFPSPTRRTANGALHSQSHRFRDIFTR